MRKKLRAFREQLEERWERLSLAVSRRIPRLSRPWRIVRNLACIAAAVYLAWLFLGQPMLTQRQMFRRAERMAAVGPSEILDTFTMPEGLGSYSRMILGETEHGYCMHPLDEPNTTSSSTQLFYQAKTGGTDLFPAPNHDYPFRGDSYTIALLLFPEVRAARAEVDLTLSAYVTEEKTFVKTWNMTADVTEEGFFILSSRIEALVSEESTALHVLSDWYNGWYIYPDPAYADVRLYDESGVLVLEERLELADCKR